MTCVRSMPPSPQHRRRDPYEGSSPDPMGIPLGPLGSTPWGCTPTSCRSRCNAAWISIALWDLIRRELSDRRRIGWMAIVLAEGASSAVAHRPGASPIRRPARPRRRRGHRASIAGVVLPMACSPVVVADPEDRVMPTSTPMDGVFLVTILASWRASRYRRGHRRRDLGDPPQAPRAATRRGGAPRAPRPRRDRPGGVPRPHARPPRRGHRSIT